MNVRQLINLLEEMDPDMDVYFSYDSKDYWGSIIASEVNMVGSETLVWSEYHRTYEVPEEEFDNDGNSIPNSDENQIDVILLSGEYDV
jgi:hypothetical protein